MSERLDKETAQKYWKQFKEDGCYDARDKLIVSYLHLVKYVVGRMVSTLPKHVKVEDLYSTGITGLVKAIERYDMTKKNKFETYAILLIKGAIIDEMRSLDWVPRSVHQKANMISQAQQELEQKLGREATDKEVAAKLKITVREYEILLERVKPAVLLPLDTPQSGDPDAVHLAERIPDRKVKTSFEHVEHKEFRKLLEKAVMDLPEKERMVLVLYYYENLMLKEIGKVIGVSESRVSQIHTKAVMRLKGRLQDFAKEFANLL